MDVCLCALLNIVPGPWSVLYDSVIMISLRAMQHTRVATVYRPIYNIHSRIELSRPNLSTYVLYALSCYFNSQLKCTCRQRALRSLNHSLYRERCFAETGLVIVSLCAATLAFFSTAATAWRPPDLAWHTGHCRSHCNLSESPSSMRVLIIWPKGFGPCCTTTWCTTYLMILSSVKKNQTSRRH